MQDQNGQNNIILLHENTPSQAKPACGMLETLNWEVLYHAAYSPDLSPSDYHLSASMGHALVEQCFSLYREIYLKK